MFSGHPGPTHFGPKKLPSNKERDSRIPHSKPETDFLNLTTIRISALWVPGEPQPVGPAVLKCRSTPNVQFGPIPKPLTPGVRAPETPQQTGNSFFKSHHNKDLRAVGSRPSFPAKFRGAKI